MQTPNFLQELITSDEYGDKSSETYKRATRYMNILYPGTVQFDVTGHMVRPEYDMTLKQFYNAQGEIDAEFEAEKDEAEAEIIQRDNPRDQHKTLRWPSETEEDKILTRNGIEVEVDNIKGIKSILEKNKEYFLNDIAYDVMEHSCQYFGSSYRGRKEGARDILGA